MSRRYTEMCAGTSNRSAEKLSPHTFYYSSNLNDD